MKKDKKYLITGGSGFLGTALVARLVKDGFNNLVVVSKNEESLLALRDRFPQVTTISGDVSDLNLCRLACRDVNGVFHLAAFKHVSMAETNARECIKSNVIGSMNILDNSLDADFVIGISTDKVVKRAGVYGVSKWLMEKLFFNYEQMNPQTKYRLVRYGNVLYSPGSVLVKWKDKIQRGEKIQITSMSATRFFWTVDEAIDLIFECLKKAKDSQPYHREMKSIRIKELVECMWEKYLPSGKFPDYELIGLQPGENVHELIVENGVDSSKAEQYSRDEIKDLI